MKVTGNTLIAFEKWLVNNESIQDLNNVDSRMRHWLTYKGFENLPDEMKIGVFISFFESVGIQIDPNTNSVLIANDIFNARSEAIDTNNI